MTRPRVLAVVPSAGCGKRLGLKTKKPFLLVNGRPLIAYTISVLQRSRAIDSIIVAVDSSSVGKMRRIVKKFRFSKVLQVVVGGKTRRDSVKRCIKNMEGDFDIVLIHDGARPFLNEDIIKRTVLAAGRYGACVAGVKEIDTVKLVDKNGFVEKTLNRDSIYRIQTPQAFNRRIIEKAYNSLPATVTDDAELAERMGARVKVVEGSYGNIKITNFEDLKIFGGAKCA